MTPLAHPPTPCGPHRTGPEPRKEHRDVPRSPAVTAAFPTLLPAVRHVPGNPPPRPTPRTPTGTGIVPPLGHHSDLRILRSAYRWQRRTATLTALGYFTLFLVLSAFAPSLHGGRRSPTDCPPACCSPCSSCPSPGWRSRLYEHTARRYVDPIADRIRKQSELDAKRDCEGATRR